MTPDLLDQQRQDLLAEIHAAFKDVTRAGGVSWNESKVIDDYGTPEEELAARATDTDRHWTDLLQCDWCRPDVGSGGFSFLDAIGFRYYLPVAMIKSVVAREDNGICSRLGIPPPGAGLRNYTLEQLSLLDQRQRRCVARFIRFMIALAEQQDLPTEVVSWQVERLTDVLKSHGED